MKYYFILLSLLLFTYTQPLWAQNAENDTTRLVNLNEVVVSVNKSSETRKTIAQQVQVLHENEIARVQAQSTADLIQSTGTVFIQKSQMGGGSVNLRGFEASRTLLVVDGVRMNNLIYRAGHLQNIITLDNNSLERAEILFGPSSTIYGSDALGGVIHLFTKKPNFSETDHKLLKVNAMTRYGSVNSELTGHIDVNAASKKLASLTSLTYSKFGDLMGGKNTNPFYNDSYGERPFYVERVNGKDSLLTNTDKYKQVQSAYHQYDVMQKLAYRPSENAVHGLNVQFSNSSDVPRYDRLTDPKNGGLAYAEWVYGPQKRFLAAYDLNYKKPVLLFQDVHLGLNYQRIEESRISRKFNSDWQSNRIEDVQVIGLNLDVKKALQNHIMRYGIDGQWNTLQSTAFGKDVVTGQVQAIDTRYPDGDNTMFNAALYFSHTWQINPTLVLTDGFRTGYAALHSTIIDNSYFNLPVTEFNQNTAVVSGTLGLIHTPSDDLKLSALISTGFRVPNTDDMSKVFESAQGAVIVPNEELKPEKTITSEIGITRIFNKSLVWESSLYYTRFFDAIVADVFLFKGQDSILYEGAMSRVYANQNKKEAYIYGFSSAVSTKHSEFFSMNFGINYTYGRIKTDSSDTPLDHIPPFMAHLKLTYTYHKFNADLRMNYNGWKRMKDYNLGGEDNEQYATPDGMPAWFCADLRFSFQVNKNLIIQAGIDNLFDTQYRTFASGINAPGRNLFGTLRFRL